MSELLEFVPNFSEGKDQAVVDAVVSQMTAVAGVTCLSAELDGSHNRAVVTLAGDKAAVAEAAFVGAKAAMERIDLRGHVGDGDSRCVHKEPVDAAADGEPPEPLARPLPDIF